MYSKFMKPERYKTGFKTGASGTDRKPNTGGLKTTGFQRFSPRLAPRARTSRKIKHY
jgi:hypothetical protein